MAYSKEDNSKEDYSVGLRENFSFLVDVPDNERELKKSKLVNQERIYSVSEICEVVNRQVSKIKDVSVNGEISDWNFKSNYAFFSLTQEDAVIRCFFSQAYLNLVNFEVRTGLRVVIKGSVSFYKKSGQLSIFVKSMFLEGEGGRKKRLEKILSTLRELGYLGKHLTLPPVIRSVAVITSTKGQAVLDVISTIKRRNRFMNIYIIPAVVQGNTASISIRQAFHVANSRVKAYGFDAILIVRGGGSSEDLDCFNDIDLNAYLSYRIIPIVSGVGHTGNTTIIDHVADYKAETPTAAAELVSNDLSELFVRFQELKNSLNRLMQYYLDRHKQELVRYRAELKRFSLDYVVRNKQLALARAKDELVNQLSRNISTKKLSLGELSRKLKELNPLTRLNNYSLRLNELRSTLLKLVTAAIENEKTRVSTLKLALQKNTPQVNIVRNEKLLAALKQRLENQMLTNLSYKRHRFATLATRLDAISPLRVLEKGYSYTTYKGRMLKTTKAVKPGDIINTRLANGSLEARVISLEEK